VDRSVRFIELAGRYGIHIGGAVNLLSFCEESYVDLYVRTVAAAGRVNQRLLHGFTQAETAQLESLLARMLVNAQAHTAAIRGQQP
jgi:hypothetical protein